MRYRKLRFCMILMGMIVMLQPQCAKVCQAETDAVKNAETDYTFDEETGTLTFYGQGMLGHEDRILYEDDYQSYSSGYINDKMRFGVDLEKIRKVVIGDGITGIYESFFQSMKWIEEVEFGANVAEIQRFAFVNCSALRTITLSPANPYLKMVNQGLYSADGKIMYLYPTACGEEEPVIAPGTKTVSAGIFAHSRLKRITIPASLTALSDGMFRDCTQLEKVDFAKGSQCKNTLHSGVAGGSFEGCTKLKKLNFGEKFQRIEPNAFKGCTNLKSIYFGKAFQGFHYYGNTVLQYFYCPSNYEEDIVFPALEKIRISGKNKVYRTKNNVVFSKNGKKLYYYPIAKKGKSYRVPDSVQEIAFNAFHKNRKLQFVHTGKNTTTIGSDAFSEMEKLSRVELGEKLKTLENDAFAGSSKLKKIKNLDRVEYLSLFHRDSLGGTLVYLILWDDSKYDAIGQPGKNMTFYLPAAYRRKDVRWSVVSGKKYMKISKKYKDRNKVTVKISQSAKPKKSGKTRKLRIQAKVGKKKFFCDVICYADD